MVNDQEVPFLRKAMLMSDRMRAHITDPVKEAIGKTNADTKDEDFNGFSEGGDVID